MAWEDEPWILEGAAVRISIIGFDDGTESIKVLDGKPVVEITSSLGGNIDVSKATRLPENAGTCFLGVQLSGPFDMDRETAEKMLAAPVNPNGRPNSDVVKPLINGMDITRRPRNVFIADFGVDTPIEKAALYELPFRYVEDHVKPMREQSRSRLRDERWWLPLWSRP